MVSAIHCCAAVRHHRLMQSPAPTPPTLDATLLTMIFLLIPPQSSKLLVHIEKYPTPLSFYPLLSTLKALHKLSLQCDTAPRLLTTHLFPQTDNYVANFSLKGEGTLITSQPATGTATDLHSHSTGTSTLPLSFSTSTHDNQNVPNRLSPE